MSPAAADLPRTVHDGADDLDRLVVGTTVVTVGCPRCRAALEIDPVDVVQRGQPVAVLSLNEADHVGLAGHLSGHLGFDVLRFSDLAVLEGTDGLSPSALDLPCPGCGAELLAVASFGEIQPGRWRLVAEGLIPAPADPTDPTDQTNPVDANPLDANPVVADPVHADPVHADPGAPGGNHRVGVSNGDGSSTGDHGAGTGTGAGVGRPDVVPVAERLKRAVSRRRLLLLVALVVPVALVVWLHATAWVAWSDARYLTTQGERATAELVASEGPAVAADDGGGYRLTYRFSGIDADGRPFKREATRQVSRAVFDAARSAGSVEVLYDPDDPDRSDLDGNDRSSLVILITVVADILLIGAVIVVVRAIRRARAAGPAGPEPAGPEPAGP